MSFFDTVIKMQFLFTYLYLSKTNGPSHHHYALELSPANL